MSGTRTHMPILDGLWVFVSKKNNLLWLRILDLVFQLKIVSWDQLKGVIYFSWEMRMDKIQEGF